MTSAPNLRPATAHDRRVPRRRALRNAPRKGWLWRCQIDAMVRHGVDHDTGLPLGWKARSPWLGEERYLVDELGPVNSRFDRYELEAEEWEHFGLLLGHCHVCDVRLAPERDGEMLCERCDDWQTSLLVALEVAA